MIQLRRAAVSAFLLTSAPLAAQVRGSAEVDATWVESDAVGESWGVTLAPSLLYQPAPGASLLVGGAYGRYSDDLWAFQGTFDATFTPGQLGPFRPELALSAAALSASGDDPTNLLALGRGRLHWAGGRAGLWGGGGGGAANGDLSHTVVFGDLGGWTSIGPATIAGSVLPTSVDPGGDYLDAELALRAAWRRLDLTAGAGRRWWSDAGFADESWGSVALEFRLFPRLALTAAAGRFPTDPVRGFGDGRYLQVGARVGAGPGPPADGWALRQAYRSRPPIAQPVVAAFRLETVLAMRVFLVEAPGASRVELAADFTDWEPVAFVRGQGGTWRLERAIPPGSYHFNLRVDGGPWGAPPGVPTVRDDFGGVGGLLVLE